MAEQEIVANISIKTPGDNPDCLAHNYCEVISVLYIWHIFTYIREEAARLWSQREDEWNRERAARERLMKDVSINKRP